MDTSPFDGLPLSPSTPNAPNASSPVKRRPNRARVATAASMLLLATLGASAGLGCGSGAATSGTSSGAGSVGCAKDSDCTAFSSTCCDCADSAAHNSEVRSLTPSCDRAERCNANTCTNDSRMAQCNAGKCVLRTAPNLTTTTYDQSCNTAADCVGVSTSFVCASCSPPAAAINRKALAAFKKAYDEQFAGFRCDQGDTACEAPIAQPTCVNKVCKAAQ